MTAIEPESIKDYVAILNKDFEFVELNNALQSLLELPEDILIGESIERFNVLVNGISLSLFLDSGAKSGVITLETALGQAISLNIELYRISSQGSIVLTGGLVDDFFSASELVGLAEELDYQMLNEASKLAKIGVWSVDLKMMIPQKRK